MGGVLLSPVVGIAHEGVWSQVLVLKHFGLGILAVMVCVRGSGEQETREKGQEFLRHIEETWHWAEGQEDGEFDLERVLKKVVGNDAHEMEAVGWHLKGSEIVMVGWGEARALVRRQGRLGVVFVGNKDEWRVIQGNLDAADRWLIGTSGLLGGVTKGLVEEVLEAESVGAAAETLTTRVQATEVSAAVAGVVVFGTGLDDEEETTQAPVLTRVEETGKPIFLKETKKKQKTAITVGIILLILLGLSVFLGARQRENNRLESVVTEALGMVKAAETQARGVAAQDPGGAGIIITQATQKLDEAKGLVQKRADLVSRLESEKERLSGVYREVTGEASLGQVGQWLGLEVIREGLVGAEMELIGSNLYVLDSQAGLIAEVVPESKEAKLVAGGDLIKGGIALSGVEGRLALRHERGVVEVNPKTNTPGILVTADDNWGGTGEVRLFGGNIYALDKTNGTIWRYPGLSSGVGAAQPWLGAGVEVPVSQVVDIAIDGDIWLVLTNGTVMRLRRGAVEGWKMGNVATPVTAAVAIETKTDDEQVYVLDQEVGRVVAFLKETGNYQEQYRWDGFKGVTDIAVDEAGGFLYALSGGSIYRIPL